MQQELETLGLSKKEARVYISLLELGESSASNIAQKAGVNRATTYVVLDSLIEKGLVSTYDTDKVTHYVASSPDTLQVLVEHKKQEWEKKQKHLNGLLPELKSLNNSEKGKPVIRFFEGKDGLLESYKEFLSDFGKEDETVKYFYTRDKIIESIDDSKLEEFINIRLDKGLKAETIYTYSKGELKDRKKSNEIKIDENNFPISIDLEIYGDNVFISTLEENLSAILIKNKNIADSLKTLFRLAQSGAKAEQEKQE